MNKPIIKKLLNEAKLKLPLKKISTIDKTIMDILFYTFEGPRSQYINYNTLTNTEKDIISPEMFDSIKNIIQGKETFNQSSPFYLRGTIKNILHYLYKDINWEHSKLTPKEKEIISPEIFQILKLWTYGKIQTI